MQIAVPDTATTISTNVWIRQVIACFANICVYDLCSFTKFQREIFIFAESILLHEYLPLNSQYTYSSVCQIFVTNIRMSRIGFNYGISEKT